MKGVRPQNTMFAPNMGIYYDLEDLRNLLNVYLGSLPSPIY